MSSRFIPVTLRLRSFHPTSDEFLCPSPGHCSNLLYSHAMLTLIEGPISHAISWGIVCFSETRYGGWIRYFSLWKIYKPPATRSANAAYERWRFFSMRGSFAVMSSAWHWWIKDNLHHLEVHNVDNGVGGILPGIAVWCCVFNFSSVKNNYYSYFSYSGCP